MNFSKKTNTLQEKQHLFVFLQKQLMNFDMQQKIENCAGYKLSIYR